MREDIRELLEYLVAIVFVEGTVVWIMYRFMRRHR